MKIKETEYLTWEYCNDPDVQYLSCPAPTPIADNKPDWFKNLSVNIKQYNPDSNFEHTIKSCLGFRGLINLGYTIPLPEEVTALDTYFSRGRINADMVPGTKFDQSWRFRLLNFPWRAKMAKGWRLLILPYLLDWPEKQQSFAGAVAPNYRTCQNNCSVDMSLKWDIEMDIEKYNYYAIEPAVAFKQKIPKGSVIFTLLPFYDDELHKKQKEQYNV